MKDEPMKDVLNNYLLIFSLMYIRVMLYKSTNSFQWTQARELHWKLPLVSNVHGYYCIHTYEDLWDNFTVI